MIAWMLYAVLVAALLGAAAVAAERGLSLLRRPVRLVWMATMIAGAVLPLAGLVLARPDPIAETAAPDARAAEVNLWLAPTATLERVGTAAANADALAGVLWAAASLMLLAGLVWSQLRLMRARESWERETVDGHDVHVSSDLGPAVVGPIRGEIVVPRWLVRDTAPAERRAALCHEHEHVAARDGLLVWLGALVAVAFPWNAPLWWQLRRLRAAVELDCDRRVLAAGQSSIAYADLLLRVGERRGAFLLGPALTEPRSLLGRRIEAMINVSVIPHRVARMLSYAVVAVVLVALACDTPAPTPANRLVGSDEQSSLDLSQVYAETAPGLTSPERVSCPPIDYPRELRQAGIEGQVLLQFVIERDGSVQAGNIEILSVSQPAFESPAKGMIAGCRFRAGVLGGESVRTLVQMPIIFTLGHSAGSAPASAIRVTGPEPWSERFDPADYSALSAKPDPDTITMILLRDSTDTRARRAAQEQMDEVPALPQFVLNGVFRGHNLRIDSLNPDDIESIEVVKGEAVVRRYGERARSGVIVITTKSGKRN